MVTSKSWLLCFFIHGLLREKEAIYGSALFFWNPRLKFSHTGDGGVEICYIKQDKTCTFLLVMAVNQSVRALVFFHWLSPSIFQLFVYVVLYVFAGFSISVGLISWYVDFVSKSVLWSLIVMNACCSGKQFIFGLFSVV